MEHKNAQELLRYWQTLNGETTVPQQRHLKPAEMKNILPSVFVLQRYDAQHFTFRLAGTGYCALFGREFRTQNILALFQDHTRKYFGVLLDRVVGVPCAGIAQAQAETLSGETCSLEYLLLPLADADGRVNRILGTANVTSWGTASRFDRFAHQKLISMQVRDPSLPYSVDAPTEIPGKGSLAHVRSALAEEFGEARS